MEKYNHLTIEKKWQDYWEKNKSFEVKEDKKRKKFYNLVEFPYVSGDGLHTGHPRSYTALDIVSHKRRMQGYNVLYPIGFDSFGLPTENYAIKTKTQPQIITEKNIKLFTRQLKGLGFSFDWSRAFSTADEDYYKWTQWIFIKMWEKGLAYKAKENINWCTKCKIGLANEEVVGGVCERCGGEVVKKEKEQWVLKITQYADRLIDDLEQVDYSERIKTQQINWIGRSEGATVKFQIPMTNDQLNPKSQIPHPAGDHPEGENDQNYSLEVFTTRPDTLFGATFMVVAPEHELIANQESGIRNYDEVKKYVEMAKRKSDLERTELSKEKTGVELKGIKAINPVNGKEIPIFVADYVLAGYGSGAIMAVPAHDERDFAFAKKYKLPIIEVIKGGDIKKEAYTDIDAGEMVNSGEFNGLPVKECIKKITAWLEKENLGKGAVNYHLRDWIFSRQRYWGEPIPLIFCENCAERVRNQESGIRNQEFNQGELLNPGWIAVPENQLPVTLPMVEDFAPTDTGESPLAKAKDWVATTCPKCGGPAKRETDVMPNWAGSNWYFIRYCDPKNNQKLVDEDKAKYWLPVDWYNGGMEHTTLHLLYSRFVYKFLYDIGAVPKECGSEPYKKRTAQGMVLGEGGIKMSKSKGNVINPDEYVKKNGADTVRMYEMFMGPFDRAIPWDTKGVIGVRRFLDRVYNLGCQIIDDSKKSKVKSQKLKVEVKSSKYRLLHKTIKKVSEDIETMDFNTAVSQMMIFVNGAKEIDREILEKFLIILAPFAPHLAEELWEKLGHKDSIFKEKWPEYDKELIKDEIITLVIQINGKVRDNLSVAADISEKEATTQALASEKVQKFLAGQKPKKIIFVKGKLINIVV